MATAGKARAVQVPGETAPPVDAAPEAEHEQGAEMATEVGEQNAADEVNDEVASLRAQLAEANAKLAAKSAPAVQRAPIAKEKHTLPEPGDVDASKIKAAVLTTRGYVVPATLTPARG